MTESPDIKLWHDDVRPAPKDWVWARTNAEAQKLLASGRVTEISMDHDLGALPEDGIYAKGAAEETGLDLAKWITNQDTATGRVESIKNITVHSWNPYGARRMAETLADAGYSVLIKPFSV